MPENRLQRTREAYEDKSPPERVPGSGHVRHELSITRKATLPKETK